MYHIDIIGNVAAAPGPLACPSRSARPRKLLKLKVCPGLFKLVEIYVIYRIDGGRGVKKLYTRTYSSQPTHKLSFPNQRY